MDGCLRIAQEPIGRNQQATRVGAYRSAAKTAETLLDVAERTGLTPPGRQAWKRTREIDAAARKLIEIGQRHGIDPGELITEIEADETLAMAVGTSGPLR